MVEKKKEEIVWIEILLWAVVVLLIISVVLGVLGLRRKPDNLLEASLADFNNSLDRLGKDLRDEFQRNREESNKTAHESRKELAEALEKFESRFGGNVKELGELQKQKLDDYSRLQNEQAAKTENRLEKMRETIENKLKELQEDNSQKLEKMRETVDEKLQKTLNARISESFKTVTEQLEQVYKGLGDMQKLATGVGDLKKVLSNVKTRGTMGEIQLGAILEQFLSVEQYVHNARIKKATTESVEYAVKLPGKDVKDVPVLLPIDSKFPMEDYQRLTEIYDNIDSASREEILKAENQFDAVVKKSAKTIREKYIDPPKTTNFALMFLPTEGLYAQILRRPGLFEALQQEFKITVVGPSNLVAFLSSLQMGFRTLAVQQRSNEVWNILSAVKSEFGNFENVLKAAQKKINMASGDLDKLVGTRTRAMKKKLRDVEELPGGESAKLLELDEEPELFSEETEEE